MKTGIGLLAALILTGLTLTYALWDVDLANLWQTLISGEPWILAPFLLILIVFYITNAARWGLMLRPFGHYSVTQLAPSMMIGFAANYVLPFRIGEFIRAYLLATEINRSKSGVLMTLILERFLDLSAILILYIIGLQILADVPSGFRASGWLASLALLGMLAGMALFLYFPNTVHRIWRTVGEVLPDVLVERGAIYLQEFDKGLSSLRDPRITLLLITESLLRWLLAALLVWLTLRAYGPVPSMALCMVVVGVAAVAVSIPSAPGFIGPMQAAFVLALTPFGIDQEIALSASILFLLGHFLPIVAVGGWYFVTRHLSIAQIRREIETQE